MAKQRVLLVDPYKYDVTAIFKGKDCYATYGSNLYFQLGSQNDDEQNAWRDSASTHSVQLAIEYFDDGTDTIVVGYTTDGSTETTETIVTKGNTGKWKTKFFTLASAITIGSLYYVSNGLADIRIYSAGTLYISLVNATETSIAADAQNTPSGDARTFSKDIASDNFVTGSAGWAITREGNAEFNNVTVRGTIYATAGQIANFNIGTVDAYTISADTGKFKINSNTPSIAMGESVASSNSGYGTGEGIWMGKYGASDWRFRIGNPAGAYISYAGGTLSIVGASVTIGAGTNVGGWLIASSPDRLINDTGVESTSAGMAPSDYPFYAGAQYANRATAPFRVTTAGNVYATSVTISGTMTFSKSLISAHAGSQIVAKSASVLTSGTTATATTFSVVVKGQGGAAPFASGEHIRLTNGAGTSTYATVGSATGTDPYTYTATYTAGSNSAVFLAGDTVVDYGTTGQGYLFMTADDSNAPFYSVRTWSGANPTSSTTETVRLGNLGGLTFGGSSLSGYGLYTTSGYFTGTIIGSTIKTATSNQRVELTSNYIVGYNASNVGVFGFALSNNNTFGQSNIPTESADYDTGDFFVGTNGELAYDASNGLLSLKGLATRMKDVSTTGHFTLDPEGYSFVRLTGTATIVIDDIVPSPGANGQLLLIKNDGNAKLILRRNYNAGTGSPINTQSTKDITLEGYGNALLNYDSTNDGWTAIAFRSKGIDNGGLGLAAMSGTFNETVTMGHPQSVRGFNGVLTVGLSSAETAAVMSVPGSGTWTMTVWTLEDGAYIFSTGDIIEIKADGYTTWFTVARATLDADLQTYTCTYASGDRPVDYGANVGVFNYGQSGQGILYMAAVGTGSPYYSVRTHAGSPWTTETEHVRMGNLNGNWGYVAATYGFAVGEYSSNKPNITIDSTNGLRIRNYTSNVITMDTSGNASIAGDMTIGASLSIGTSGNIKSGATAYNTGTGFFLEYNGGTPRFFIGNAAANKLTWDGTTLSISGSLTSTTGTIGGWTINSTTITGGNATLGSTGVLTLGTSNDVVIASAVDSTYRLWVGNATAASAPFRVSKAGEVTATNVTITGSTGGIVFNKSVINAFAGSFLVAKSASVLDAAATATGTTFSISVKAQGGAAPFASGGNIRFTDGTNTTWATVGASSGTGPYTYTATYTSGSNSATYAFGTTVIDYGTTGQGYLYVSADDSEGPFYSARSWATNPYTGGNNTEHVRLGNMRNAFGTGANNYYGIGIGNYSTGNYLSYNSNDGLKLRGTTSAASIALGATPPTSATSGTGLWIDYTGVYGLEGSVQQAYLRATDGKILAAGGDIMMDSEALFLGMGSDSRRYPSTMSDDATVGSIAWSNPSNAGADDGSVAFALIGTAGDISHYLKSTNFSFNIPSGASIIRVVIETEAIAGHGTYIMRAKLVKGGTISGNELQPQEGYAPFGSYGIRTFDGDLSEWGVTLTESDVEASTFGCAIYAENSGVSDGFGIGIDYVRMIVYYSTSTGQPLIQMNGNYIMDVGKITLTDGAYLAGGSTTGTKIGTSTSQKIGFFNATPIARPSAYTQTYSTATRTHNALTSSTLTDNSGGTANTTIQAIGASYSQTVIANNFADLAAQCDAINADLLNIKQVLNALIDDHQALGFAG